MRAVVEELCGTGFSKSTVSSLCKGLDDIVKEWNERNLSSQEYPFLLVDALVIRVRKNGRVRLLSALLAIGINREGYREILGLMLGDSESEAAWSEFFGRLNQEIRRRERVIRIFPNEESAIRLIGAVLVEIDESWTSGTRYFDMAEYWEWKVNTEKQRKEVYNTDTCVNAA